MSGEPAGKGAFEAATGDGPPLAGDAEQRSREVRSALEGLRQIRRLTGQGDVPGAVPAPWELRQPVRAVELLIAVGGDDGTTVLDLPAPIAVPVGPEAMVWDGEAATPPQEVIDLVSTRASLWGTEPRIVSASQRDGEWRVVVSIADAIGARWPFALRVGATAPSAP